VLVALHDPLLVLASFLAVFLFVLGARAAGAMRAPASAVRRGLHAAVGLWSAFIATQFTQLGLALVPSLGFLALNASGKTTRLAPALRREGETGSSSGLWTFPLGVALTYILFWNDAGRGPVMAGCLSLALADPIAAWVGTRLGQRRLRPLRLRRTLEGSLAFFLVAAIAVAWVAGTTPTAIFGPWPAETPGAPVLRLALGCGAVGALAEALSPRGWDNATIPVLVGGAYRLLA